MKRAAAPLRGDLAADDDLAAVGGVEDGFDGRLVFAGADEVGGGPAADQQPDRADEDALAGARSRRSGR